MSILNLLGRLSPLQRGALIAALGTVAVAVIWPISEHRTHPPEVVPAPPQQTPQPTPIAASTPAPSAPATPRIVDYRIQAGDTLSGIFQRQALDNATLHGILAADEDLLELETLRPGQDLQFEWSQDGQQLQRLTLMIQPGHRVDYRRLEDGSGFAYEQIVSPSHWQEQVLAASIQGSFYASAAKAGLSDADIDQAQRILGDRVNFRRDVRAGDPFQIVIENERLEDGTPTGETRIDAIRLSAGKQAITAFLHDDGSYYDIHGQSLQRAFLRYPTLKHYRVSSPFNLHRLHPVTGRVAPHYGVDFAMPVNTPILSIGDGVVVRVGNHPYAGKYLLIKHSGRYATRYLHLNKILVKAGQTVSRGQRIALSGNTGRTTGPHLHFELHVNNHPVNPIDADIPLLKQIPKTQMLAFSRKAQSMLAAMQSAQMSVAQHIAAAGDGQG